MKRRSVERVERRRNMLELNLISEAKPRLAIRRRGCMRSSLMLVAVALAPLIAALALGPH